MKEKIKKLFKLIFDNWTRFAEIGVVIWAIQGIMDEYKRCSWSLLSGGCDYHISPVWAYFLSAVLILYLLRKIKK